LKLHHQLAGLLGYDLDRRKKSHAKITYHLEKFLRTHKIELVLDVGANIGQFAQSLRALGYKGKIISFEPIKECFERIQSLSQGDSLWECHNIALSNESEQKILNVFESSDFSSFLNVSDFATSNFSGHVTQSVQQKVEMVHFKTWLDQHKIPFSKTFLKLDTQGYDLKVLEGAGSDVDKFKGLAVELSFKSLYEGAPRYLEVLNFIEDKGYRITGLYPIGRDENTLELIEADCIAVNSKLS
jgi:FkbM family methyltransferase